MVKYLLVGGNMDQEKISKLIKDIRSKNNLTQKNLADKLGVTYQAVSKWENAKNIPDISVLKQISEIYNISIDEILDGSIKNKNNKKLIYVIISAILLVIIIVGIFIITKNNDDFDFKTITTTCDNFRITGSMAYNSNKSSIYISNITYCGGNDDTLYKKIECTLYEDGIIVDTFNYNSNNEINLEEFLKTASFKINDYKNTCKNPSHSFYIIIKGYKDDKVINYEIPLSLEGDCN